MNLKKFSNLNSLKKTENKISDLQYQKIVKHHLQNELFLESGQAFALADFTDSNYSKRKKALFDKGWTQINNSDIANFIEKQDESA